MAEGTTCIVESKSSFFTLRLFIVLLHALKVTPLPLHSETCPAALDFDAISKSSPGPWPTTSISALGHAVRMFFTWPTTEAYDSESLSVNCMTILCFFMSTTPSVCCANVLTEIVKANRNTIDFMIANI